MPGRWRMSTGSPGLGRPASANIHLSQEKMCFIIIFLPSRERRPSLLGWHIERWWAWRAQNCRSWWSQNLDPGTSVQHEWELILEDVGHLPIFSADLPLVAVKSTSTRPGWCESSTILVIFKLSTLGLRGRGCRCHWWNKSCAWRPWTSPVQWWRRWWWQRWRGGRSGQGEGAPSRLRSAQPSEQKWSFPSPQSIEPASWAPQTQAAVAWEPWRREGLLHQNLPTTKVYDLTSLMSRVNYITCIVDRKISMKPIITMVKSRKFQVFWLVANHKHSCFLY